MKSFWVVIGRALIKCPEIAFILYRMPLPVKDFFCMREVSTCKLNRSEYP